MRAVFLSLSTALILATAVVPSVSAADEPSVYWGARIEGAPFSMANVDKLESHVGKRMSMTTWGQPWANNGQFQTFQTSTFQAARNRGYLPMLTWGSWDLASKAVNESQFQLADIIAGKYDAGITRWAQDAKAWGHPFLLRFDWEMNGWWYPWSEQVNGNHTGEFVKMWRHVHDIFSKVGANNVSWVWCPNIVGRNSTPMTGLYPGNSYVDWTCFDGYNWGTVKGGWQTFDEVMSGSDRITGGHDTYHELLSVAPTKPILIGEIASVESGGNKSAWVQDMLRNLPIKYPKVKAFIWNDQDEGDGADWEVESSSAAQSAFKSGIASASYATNKFGSISGKIVPLTSSTPSTSPTSSASLAPSADSYTSSAYRNTVYGTSSNLRVNESGTDTTFMRFDLSRFAGRKLVSASLKVHSSSEAWAGTSSTLDVRFVPSDTWKEAYLTFNNTAPVSSTLLGTLSSAAEPNTWYSIQLNAGSVQSSVGGSLSLAVALRETDVLLIDSRESGTGTAPVLVLTFA